MTKIFLDDDHNTYDLHKLDDIRKLYSHLEESAKFMMEASSVPLVATTDEQLENSLKIVRYLTMTSVRLKERHPEFFNEEIEPMFKKYW